MSTRELTPEDFRVKYDDNHTFEFFEDEDGNGVYTHGHVDKQAFATAVNYYDNLGIGEDYASFLEPYTEDNVRHGYATAIEDATGYGDWVLKFCGSTTEHATPVTWISR